MIYLDNASTTKPCKEAVDAMVYCMTDVFGNPSSLHRLGVEAEKIINEARKTIASSISCESECIYFTSGATESSNMAIKGIAENYSRLKKKIVTTEVEHPSVYQTISYLEKKGYEVIRVKPQKDGSITAESIINEVDENTFLVSCMLVNNENGEILPISKAFSVIKRKYPDVITHCDAVQGYMKIPFKVKDLCADIISLSGHKVEGPKGVGAIYIKKGIRVAPLTLGGGQEKKQRSGTESVPLISAFSAAVKTKKDNIKERLEIAVAKKQYLLQKLENNKDITVLSTINASPYIIAVSAGNIRSETMLHYLESKDIFVSSGSACSKGAKSHVMQAFNVDDRYLDSIIRISISDSTKTEDIDRLLEVMNEGIKNLAYAR